MNEEWKIIPEFPSYEISKDGKIRRTITFKSGELRIKQIKPYHNGNGGLSVKVYPTGSSDSKTMTLARLVYETFTGEKVGTRRYRYKDGSKDNCSLDNLHFPEPISNHSLRYYLPVVEFQTKTGMVRGEPNAIEIVQNRVPIEKLADENYQTKKAEDLFDFLIEHTPHGIFQKLVKRIDKHNKVLQRVGIQDFDMNKFNNKQLTIIKEHTINLLKEIEGK